MSYKRSVAPELLTIDELRQFVEDELRLIEQAFAEMTAVELRTVFVEPTSPRDGMIVMADGASWDPGSGEGIYAYYGGVWNKL